MCISTQVKSGLHHAWKLSIKPNNGAEGLCDSAEPDTRSSRISNSFTTKSKALFRWQLC